jgi:hypothetical protein
MDSSDIRKTMEKKMPKVKICVRVIEDTSCAQGEMMCSIGERGAGNGAA